MFYMYLFIILLISTHSFSSAEDLLDIIEREKRTSPLALRLYNEAFKGNTQQEATFRVNPPLFPISDPNSPSKLLSPLRRERETLNPLAEYCKSRIPTYTSRHRTPLSECHTPPRQTMPRSPRTPLNESSVLSAALKNIKVGPGSAFISYIIFNPEPENSDTAQMILQTRITLQKRDKKNRTNEERMELGKAPIGPDDKPITLHHANQSDGLLFELSRRTHEKMYNTLHFKISKGSKIDRKVFQSFKRRYWKHRVEPLKKTASANKEMQVRTLFR